MGLPSCWETWLVPQKHAATHLSYHAKFGRSWSNGAGI